MFTVEQTEKFSFSKNNVSLLSPITLEWFYTHESNKDSESIILEADNLNTTSTRRSALQSTKSLLGNW